MAFAEGARPGAAQLRRIVEGAEFLPLALAVIQATGDEALLEALHAARGTGGARGAKFPPALMDEVRRRAIELLDGDTPPRDERATRERLTRMVQLLGTDLDGAGYLPMILDQAGFCPQAAAPEPQATQDDLRVAVIGAGMSGICAAIALRRAGIACQVFERSGAVGGTWFDNRYPGCGVDTPSMFYAYSFEPGFAWRHHFAKRDQIAAYFEHCVDKYGVRDAISLNTEVTWAAFDEQRRLWELSLTSGGQTRTVRVHALITAVGQLNIPAVPRMDGLESFAGTTVHTAAWPEGLDVSGKRVGMIGTGASGMQVAPAIAASVPRLSIFQRSPHWVLANPQYHATIDEGQHWLMAMLPAYGRWMRAQLIWSYGDAVFPALQTAAREGAANLASERYRQNMVAHMRRELKDRPDLLEKVVPDYPPYSKRVLLDNHWFRMLKRANVDLVTEPIRAVEPAGVLTADGVRHPLDVLVLATGFQATRMVSSVDIRGRGGVRLREVWEGDNPRAYLGMTVPRFPNLFLLYGPNTNLGYGGSAIFNTECQVRYAVQCLQAMRSNGWGAIECRQDVHDAYNAEVDRRNSGMVWAQQDVDNWYRNAKGRVATNSPWRLIDYWRLTRTPDFADYHVDKAGRGVVAFRRPAGSRDDAQPGEAETETPHFVKRQPGV